MPKYKIRAYYPSFPGTLVLRTELDWERDVEGMAEENSPAVVFEVDAAQPWLYFKIGMRTGEGFVWQPGMNRIAEPRPEGRDIYPIFFSGLGGELSELQQLEGTRYRVYLPPGYEENTLKRYPVLYLHDGANLFLPEEAFLGQSWEVDETLDTLHSLNVIDQVIVVGIHAQDRSTRYTAPGYVPFAAWCAETLRPYIDQNFRTLTGPKSTAVFGSSLGGVLALHTAWSWPEVFGMAGCLSSTFGVFDDLFERIATEPPRALKVYLDSGWPKDNFERTVAMRDLLLRRGFESGRDFLYLTFPGAQHNEASWRTRIHIPFQFFFARSPGSAG